MKFQKSSFKSLLLFSEIFKNTFFYTTHPMAASTFYQIPSFFWILHKEPPSKEYTQNAQGYTSTFDEFLVSTFFSASFFIKPSKCKITDKIYQHVIWTSGNTKFYKSIVKNNVA